MEGSVPSSWKAAAVRLIPKSGAQDDPSSPANFRPIALTPAVSKLLSGILRNRWLRHMRLNNYLDTDLQKAFLPTVPGVSEHQSKLVAIIKSAKRKNIPWLLRGLTLLMPTGAFITLSFGFPWPTIMPLQNSPDCCCRCTLACQQPSPLMSGQPLLFH